MKGKFDAYVLLKDSKESLDKTKIQNLNENTNLNLKC